MLVEYGRLRKDDTVSAEDRSEQLVEIVSVLLRRSVPGDSLHLYDLEGAPAVGFEFEGRDYLLSLAGHDGPP
ncbi:hypothetical protein [Streptomyces olivochromogenes]|uniref:hypothetical protein n=1 Tax=Streptomyces olivochromogenes TaxID=1963 RepID=UPI0036B141A0